MTEEKNEFENIIDNVEPKEETPKKRGRKPSAKRKGYFYEEEEEAFKEYMTSTDKLYRDKIFQEKLYPAFTKMVESIIRRYNLFTPNENFEDTFHDTMSFLITRVNNYDTSKGYKVYSYCGTICKNYLIWKRTQTMKHMNKNLSYEQFFNEANEDTRSENKTMEAKSFNEEMIEKTVKQINHILSDNYKPPITENERKIGYALLELLVNWDDIFRRMETKKFNKTSAYYFIKEYTLLPTKEVREAMKLYKNLYFFTKKKMLND